VLVNYTEPLGIAGL